MDDNLATMCWMKDINLKIACFGQAIPKNMAYHQCMRFLIDYYRVNEMVVAMVNGIR